MLLKQLLKHGYYSSSCSGTAFVRNASVDNNRVVILQMIIDYQSTATVEGTHIFRMIHTI